MTTLNIEGKRVKVDDSFLKLSPEEQEATVEEIAEQMNIKPKGGNKADGAPKIGAAADAIQQFGERFNRGLYGFANLPTDLANMASSAVGSDFRFKRPLEAAVPGLDEMIMTVPEAQTAGGKVSGAVGEFMGANAIPSAGLLKVAPKLAAATAGSKGLAGQSVNRLTGAIAANPGRTAVGEVAASVGSGLGATTAEGQGPNAEYLAAMAGGFMAPALMAVSPLNMARRAVNVGRKRFSPEQIAKEQRRQIVSGIRNNITPEGEQAITDTLAIQRDVPGYRPSVAEATENPAFIATQREFEGGLSGADLDRAVRRYGQNEQAISRAVDDLGPQSTMDTETAFRTGRGRIDQMSRRLDQQSTALDRRQSDVGSSLQSTQRQRELGGRIREDLISRRASTKEEMGIAAREFGLNDSRPQYNFANMREQLLRSVEPRSALSDRSALPTGIIDDIRRAPDMVSLDDLMALRTRISDDIREASRVPSGDRRVPYLQSLKTELDSATDRALRNSDPELADNLANFRRMYRDDFVQPFEQGATAKALKTDATGAYVVPDEKVAKEFFSGWNQTAADQFRRVFPRGADANAAMEAAALDDLHSAAVRDGVINPNLIDAWKRKNAGVLGDFPSIGNKVNDVERTLGDISRRRASITNRKKQIEGSFLSREIAKIEGATATPETIIQQALKNPARMNRILSGLKSDAAKQAISREVWQSALKSQDPAKFLVENQAAASRALGQHYPTAMRLARAIQKNRLVPRPSGQALDTNPMASVENLLGTGLNQISSRVFAVKSGRTSARYALADIAGRAFRNMTARQARETLSEALYDPAIAKDLATALEAPEMASPLQMKRLHTFIITNGIAAGSEEERQ